MNLNGAYQSVGQQICLSGHVVQPNRQENPASLRKIPNGREGYEPILKGMCFASRYGTETMCPPP